MIPLFRYVKNTFSVVALGQYLRKCDNNHSYPKIEVILDSNVKLSLILLLLILINIINIGKKNLSFPKPPTTKLISFIKHSFHALLLFFLQFLETIKFLRASVIVQN